MRTKRMLRRGLTALAAALAMMTALAAPAFAYAGDSAEAAEQQSSGSQTAVQTEKIGTVTTNGGRLNLRDGASTSYNIIGQLPCDDTVTVIGEENGWYKVIVPEKEGYVYGGYLKVSEGTAVTGDNADTGSTGTESSGAPLTPDGNLELVDDVYQASDGKQFITVQSKNDNTFYIVIDRDKNGENVYFLNLVDEADLMALMQDGEVTVKCTSLPSVGYIQTGLPSLRNRRALLPRMKSAKHLQAAVPWRVARAESTLILQQTTP